MVPIKIGDIVLIWPYCDRPNGKLGEVIEWRSDMNDSEWVVKYLDGVDKFGRDRVHHMAHDPEIRNFGSGKDINLDTLRILYNGKSDDR